VCNSTDLLQRDCAYFILLVSKVLLPVAFGYIFQLKETNMIHRWSITVPVVVWLLGSLTANPTRSSTSNVVVVMAFTPILPATATASFYTTQQQQQPHFTSSVDTPHQPPQQVTSTSSPSSTSLDGTATSMMSPWNINPEFGAPPFGFDMNAEIWNGRIAQVRFFCHVM
jgi:hypothetical protein